MRGGWRPRRTGCSRTGRVRRDGDHSPVPGTTTQLDVGTSRAGPQISAFRRGLIVRPDGLAKKKISANLSFPTWPGIQAEARHRAVHPARPAGNYAPGRLRRTRSRPAQQAFV
jgi:hypothetical protein